MKSKDKKKQNKNAMETPYAQAILPVFDDDLPRDNMQYPIPAADFDIWTGERL